MKRIYIEYPYDVGYPHELVMGNQRAVISADTAAALLALGVTDKAPGTIPSATVMTVEQYENVRLSKKARRILTEATA